MENSGASVFQVVLQKPRVTHTLLMNFWPWFQNWHWGKENFMNIFWNKENVSQISWICAIWTVIHWWRMFNLLWIQSVMLLTVIIRNSRKKSKERRWHFKDKELAVLLVKYSPKICILLQTVLPLPSRQTLQSILSTIHCRTGINDFVWCTVKHW